MLTSLRRALMFLFVLILLNSLARAQETQPPTSQPSPTFDENLATISSGVLSLKMALEQALIEKENIRKSLEEETQKYEALVQSAMEHSDGSIDSLEKALLRIQALRQLLSASESKVANLEQQIKDDEVKNQIAIDKLKTDFDLTMKKAESDLFWTRIGLIVTGLVGLGFGIAYLLKP